MNALMDNSERRYFVLLDEANRVRAFFDDLYSGTLPEEAFEISPDLWRDWVAAGRTKQWDGTALVAGAQPTAPPPVVRTYKTDIWRRCTDAEAEALDAALAAAPARLRRLFNDSTILESNAPEYETLRAGIAAAVGDERADQLLASSFI